MNIITDNLNKKNVLAGSTGSYGVLRDESEGDVVEIDEERESNRDNRDDRDDRDNREDREERENRENREMEMMSEMDTSTKDSMEDDFHMRYSGGKHSLVPISRKQWLYLVLFQGVGSGVVNLLLNLLIAYLMFRQVPGNIIPFGQGLTCIASDIVVTSFLIPCMTGLIGFVLLKNDLRQAKLITPIDRRYLLLPVFKYIPQGHSLVQVVKRSLVFGFAGAIVFGPATLLLIYLSTGGQAMTAVWGYVAFKGCWSAIVALLVSPLLAFVVIAYADYHEV